jgi:sugar/nucleoside kinase (ribokinase family)
MSSASDMFDIAFIGHVCFDDVTPYRGVPRVAPGSAVLCGALAAARIGKNVAVITRMAPRDRIVLESLRQNGVAVHVIPSADTTYVKEVHPTADVDERRISHLASAGFFSLTDLPPLAARRVHLAGISNREFDLDFILGLKQKRHRLSADMQGFVRQLQTVPGGIDFRDVPEKREIVRRLDMVKLDVVEAKVLTGTDDLEQAAWIIESWGCPEVVITRADGVLARAGGRTLHERFSNRSVAGRTGRGDTTFAAYLARRMDHDAPEALKFAAALASIKMETPGPFTGTLADVSARMNGSG